MIKYEIADKHGEQIGTIRHVGAVEKADVFTYYCGELCFDWSFGSFG